MNSTGFNPQTPHTGLTDMNTCLEFAKVFAKKDLVSKIHIFDDNPENFSSWKASFKNAVKELSLTPMEEMDLLIQWLGNTSSATQAKSIRNANASNQGRGLQRIWDRLQDRFDNPEVVESAIKRKLAKFPKLGNKDSTKLYELFDIVSEIEFLEENPVYSTLLAYFDSSSWCEPHCGQVTSLHPRKMGDRSNKLQAEDWTSISYISCVCGILGEDHKDE